MPIRTNKSLLLLIILAILFYCLDYYFRIVPSLVVRELMQQYSGGPTLIGGFYSTFYLGYLTMQLPAGILLDRFSPQKIIAVMIFFCSFFFICFVWALEPWLGLLLRFLIGVFSAFSFISVLYIARHYFSDKYFSLISGVTIGAGTMAAALVQSFSAYLSQNNDWHWVLSLQAALGFLIIVGLAFVKTKKLEELRKSEKTELGKSFSQLLGLIKNKFIVMNGLVGAFFYLPTSIFAAAWGVTFLHDYYLLSTKAASIGILLLFAGWAIGSPLMGYFGGKSQRFPWLILICSLLLIFISVSLLYFSSWVGSDVYAILLLFGILSSAQVLIWRRFVEICPINLTGVGVALTNMIITLATSVFHLFAAYLISFGTAGELNLVLGLSVMPILFLVAAILSLFLLIESHHPL